MSNCIFCSIVAGESPCHKVWEDAEHLAFLSIFPNTDGVTVVIPKQHHSSYIFEVPEEVMTKLNLAARKVARAIDVAFPDVGRTGLIYEGFGVNHLHAKLFPMHGTGNMEQWSQIESNKPTEFFQNYPGYLSSHDCTRADDGKLAEIAAKIREQV
jgi:histidine triad (HIT) family protein